MQFGAPADHVTDGLVIARGRWFGRARLFLFPDTHRNMNARSEILLPHLPFRRILRLDLLDACVSHFASCGNQPRRNEEREERIKKAIVLFVSSWLIFILSPASLIATRGADTILREFYASVALRVGTRADTWFRRYNRAGGIGAPYYRVWSTQ